jgi:hypothetical protein
MFVAAADIAMGLLHKVMVKIQRIAIHRPFVYNYLIIHSIIRSDEAAVAAEAQAVSVEKQRSTNVNR